MQRKRPLPTLKPKPTGFDVAISRPLWTQAHDLLSAAKIIPLEASAVPGFMLVTLPHREHVQLLVNALPAGTVVIPEAVA